MALVKGTNSYATVAEADTYFEDRVGFAEWDEADDEDKARYLVTASQLLDEKSWAGYMVDEDQAMAWPRVGSYFDPRRGTSVAFESDEIPTRVVTATYELARHLLINGDVLDSTSSAIDIQVDSIKISKITSAPVIPSTINRLIRPLLMNQGSNLWWRAN
jgi:hypothetical protein